MYLRTTFKRCNPTPEMISRVRELCRGGEAYFDAAELSAADQHWWTSSVTEIARSLQESLDIEGMTDAELIAQIPESKYGRFDSKEQRARIQKAHVENQRRNGGWVLVVGFLLRDSERVVLAALDMEPAVLKARKQLRAFAAAVAITVGCATIERYADGNGDEEVEDVRA